MASHQLPRRPHPIASAFFNAFDEKLETSDSKVASDGNSTVTKIRNSLGWRMRYSSSALYPISVVPVEGRRLLKEGGGELASFHVRQVFPGQSNQRNVISRDNENIDNNNADIHRMPKSVSEGDCELGTGATVWPGSIILLKYLEKIAHDPHQENVLAGATVADLGSGTAITSVASALLGAKLVVCTDGCDPVVELARRNIREAVSALGSGGEVASPESADGGDTMHECKHYDLRGCKLIAQKYRWGEGMEVPCDITDDNNTIHGNLHDGRTSDEDVESKSQRFDIILVADCIVPKLYPIQPLIDAIDELSSNETITYLSYEHRHYPKYNPAEEFQRLAALRNLDVEVVPDEELPPLYPAEDIQIWKVRRNNKLCMDAGIPKKGRQKVCLGTDGRSNHKSLLVGEHS